MKNKLIVLTIMSLLGNSTANAFEWKLPSFLGGKSNDSLPPIAVGTVSNPVATPSTEIRTVQPEKNMITSVTQTEVNPYTGVKAQTENLKLKIDAAVTEADLYDKQFEAGKKKFLLDNKDKLYKKELSEKLSSGTAGGVSNSKLIDIPDLISLNTKQSKPSKQTKNQPLLAAPAVAATPYMPPAPQLIGIVTNGKNKSAILAMGSETATVNNGDVFAGKKVSGISDNSVMLDNKKINLNAAVNILTNPDKQDIGSGGKGVKPSGNPMLAVQPQIQPNDGFPMPGNMPLM